MYIYIYVYSMYIIYIYIYVYGYILYTSYAYTLKHHVYTKTDEDGPLEQFLLRTYDKGWRRIIGFVMI